MEKSLQNAIALGIIISVIIGGYYLLYQAPKQKQAAEQKQALTAETNQLFEVQAQQNNQKNLQSCLDNVGQTFKDALSNFKGSLSDADAKIIVDIYNSRKNDCYKLYPQ